MMNEKYTDCLNNKEFVSSLLNRVIKYLTPNHLQYDKQNHFIREWSSIQEASKYIKGDIGAAVRGKQKIAGNFIWKAK